MQFLNYFFASIISYFGLLIGILLVKIAPEEQKLLEKKFYLLRKFFLLLIFLFLIFYYSSNLSYLPALLLYALFIIFIEFRLKDLLKKSIIIYTALGLIFYLSSRNLNLFVMESSLILLYGLPTASILYSKKEKNSAKILLCNIAFLLIANIAFFI